MYLQNRKRMRLNGFDYSQSGYYFITFCTYNKQHLFGKISNGYMALNAYGKIVHETYIDLPNHNQGLKLDIFVIMPNHIHGIITINNSYCRERFITVPSSTIAPPTEEIIKSHGVPEIIRQLKTFSSRRINENRMGNGLEPFPTNGIWQKSYYDHIIRNEQDYQGIWQYIDQNPLKWQYDKYFS